MSRINKLRFALACTDGWDEIVIVNNEKQTITHDDASVVFKCTRNQAVDSELQQQLSFPVLVYAA